MMVQITMFQDNVFHASFEEAIDPGSIVEQCNITGHVVEVLAIVPKSEAASWSGWQGDSSGECIAEPNNRLKLTAHLGNFVSARSSA
jgi:hypothetical protein